MARTHFIYIQIPVVFHQLTHGSKMEIHSGPGASHRRRFPALMLPIFRDLR